MTSSVAETEGISWMHDEMFLCPDEHSYLCITVVTVYKNVYVAITSATKHVRHLIL